MRKEIYNQKNTQLIFDGIILQGLSGDSPITVSITGGDVALTEGTDGGALNVATIQGIKVSASFRETSPTTDRLNDIVKMQQTLAIGRTLMLQTGADVKYVLTNVLVSKPGDLSSGGKTQGTQTYDFIATNYGEY